MGNFTTIDRVRASSSKVELAAEFPDLSVTNRIEEAEDIMIADLSSVANETDLIALGTGSKVLVRLSTYKAMQISLVRLMGASRRAGTVSDIDYWKKEYDTLLKKVLNGEVNLTDGTTSESATDYPVFTSGNSKLYPQKGIPGFFNDNTIDNDTQDDPVT